MKTQSKKALLTLLLVLVLSCIFALTFTASAESYNGSCGDNVTWSLDTESYVLKIEGTGEMERYSDMFPAPWEDFIFYIRKVIIEDGVTSIGDRAFALSYLSEITIPDSVTEIGKHAFYYCLSLEKITIPNSVTKIGSNAFEECQCLTEINLPDGLTEISYRVFANCYKLAEITIPDSVTKIGNSAFYNCHSLSNVIIPDSVTEIDNLAFSHCSRITELVIPNSVTRIGVHAFQGTGITKITLPDNLTEIGTATFLNCIDLPGITIPDSVTKIGDRAFYACRSFTEITIPDGITKIDKSTFEFCDSLTDITIPNSVTVIDTSAFLDCDSLSDVYYNGTEEEWFSIAIADENEDLTNARIHFNNVDHAHSYTSQIITAPTCIHEGLKKAVCSCGAYYIQKLLPVETAHSMSAWTQVTPATCTASGEETCQCVYCGYIEHREIAPTPHTDADNDGICDECGNEIPSKVAGFFAKIKEFFQKILDWFKNLFR